MRALSLHDLRIEDDNGLVDKPLSDYGYATQDGSTAVYFKDLDKRVIEHIEQADDVTGVDNRPMPRYPFRFIQADALEYVRLHGHEYAAIHASPPCQLYSMAAQSQRNQGKEYPDLLGPTRDLLIAAGLPWVIENVPGAPMRADFRLCGCQFGLALRRERWFETSWNGFALLPPCAHLGPVVSVVGHGTPSWVRQQLGYNPTIHHYRAAMNIDWMNRSELSQAIPPAYSEFVGRQIMATL